MIMTDAARRRDTHNETIKEKTMTQLQKKKTKTATKCPYQLGKVYFLRTVTHYYTGRLVAVTPQELVIDEAAWIADTGRFHEAMQTGNFSEVEPFPAGRLILGRGALVDAWLAPFAAPRSVK